MITFEQVTKRYPDQTVAVDGLDLSIGSGELTVLVGPSGCGKTTTLRMINRLESASAGRITIEDRAIDQGPVVMNLNLVLGLWTGTVSIDHRDSEKHLFTSLGPESDCWRIQRIRKINWKNP